MAAGTAAGMAAAHHRTGMAVGTASGTAAEMAVVTSSGSPQEWLTANG